MSENFNVQKLHFKIKNSYTAIEAFPSAAEQHDGKA